MNNAILTNDNMIRRNWSGDPSCYFCGLDESIPHLLFHCSIAKAVWAIVVHSIGANDIPKSLDQCWHWCNKWLPDGKQFHAVGIAAVCWAIWKTRNRVCFEGHVITSPITIICYTCSLMSYWAGLFLENDKKALIAVVNTMLEIAVKLLDKMKSKKRQRLMIEEEKDNQED